MMNKTLILFSHLFLGLVYTIFGQEANKLSTTEELGQQVFKSMKENDFSLFKSLLITEQKYDLILSMSGASKKEKAKSRKTSKANLSYLHYQAKQNFDSILYKAKAANIDWENAEITEIKHFPRENLKIERADIYSSKVRGY